MYKQQPIMCESSKRHNASELKNVAITLKFNFGWVSVYVASRIGYKYKTSNYFFNIQLKPSSLFCHEPNLRLVIRTT